MPMLPLVPVLRWLTMLLVNGDIRWLLPLFLAQNLTMLDTTFGYQITSLNFSSPTSLLPALTSSRSTTLPPGISDPNRVLVLTWSVRIIGGLLIIIGGIGNTLSALTLSRKKLRAQVTSIYLIALALSDLGNVFFSVLNFFLIRLNPSQNMRLQSNLACKLHIFFTYYFITLSPTLLVAVSVQRYLAVAKHHYSRKHCTVKNAYVIISLLCLLIFVTQLHWGIFYELQTSPLKAAGSNRTIRLQRVCNVSSSYPTYFWIRSHAIGYIQWFCFTLCPFVTMLFLNCAILRVIASARRIQQRMNQKNQRKRAKQRNMTIMLLSVSCVFILLTAPASTFMAFGNLIKNLHGPNFQSLWTVFSLIYYANTAANFLLYFLTANVFRQELRVMILALPGCAKLLPESSRLLQANTLTTGVGKFTTLGKSHQTSMPLTASAEERVNGVDRKGSGHATLAVNSTNRLLSIPTTVNSSSTTSHDDDSRL